MACSRSETQEIEFKIAQPGPQITRPLSLCARPPQPPGHCASRPLRLSEADPSCAAALMRAVLLPRLLRPVPPPAQPPSPRPPNPPPPLLRLSEPDPGGAAARNQPPHLLGLPEAAPPPQPPSAHSFSASLNVLLPSRSQPVPRCLSASLTTPPPLPRLPDLNPLLPACPPL